MNICCRTMDIKKGDKSTLQTKIMKFLDSIGLKAARPRNESRK
jgi:hypothetical protein